MGEITPTSARYFHFAQNLFAPLQDGHLSAGIQLGTPDGRKETSRSTSDNDQSVHGRKDSQRNENDDCCNRFSENPSFNVYLALVPPADAKTSLNKISAHVC